MPKPTYVTLCTAPEADAEKIASALVEKRLAACVNILGNCQSIYRWDGKITADTEALLIIKTSEDKVDRLREELVDLHPYDVPEVLALAVDSGHIPYIDWIQSSVKTTVE